MDSQFEEAWRAEKDYWMTVLWFMASLIERRLNVCVNVHCVFFSSWIIAPSLLHKCAKHGAALQHKDAFKIEYSHQIMSRYLYEDDCYLL